MQQIMLKFILVLFIGLLNLPKTIPCVVQYGQCGGVDYTGSTQCCPPSACVYSNNWYSQCIPSSAPSTTGCSAVYGQCGGQNWLGSTCCDYSTCIYSNPWYSQCLPDSSPSTSSSSTDSTITSSTTQSSAISSTSSSSTDSTHTPTTTQSSSSSLTTSSTTNTESTSSTSTNQGCSALYDQCSGIGWNGPTSCCSGSTCTYANAYYSQCLLDSSSSSDSGTASSTTISSENDDRQPGVTTRYWDCCKPSCGWSGKASVTSPVETCAKDGNTPVDVNTQSGCTGGSAYMCNNQQPWNVSLTLSYGYAAAHITGQVESDWCCGCYSLIFTSKEVVGKELIVQVTNTGGDLGNNHFDLAMPGGGVGIFDGCLSQFEGSYSGGERYGGVSQRSDCDNLPVGIRSGCYWRFDWFMNADNPSILLKQVECPPVLTNNTQCVRI